MLAHCWGLKCSIPARALMRERSKSRAELFSLSQSVSAARSQRLLMSLYCCWISKLSKSVGEMVLMVSRLEKNSFNLHKETNTKAQKHPKLACTEKEEVLCIILDTYRWNVWEPGIRRFSSTNIYFCFNRSQIIQLHSSFIFANDICKWMLRQSNCNDSVMR